MSERAVTDVVGFLLVFALVASIVGIVSVAGLDTLEEARYGEQTNNAERAFDVLADNLKDVHREGAPSRATEVSLQNARIETTGRANINVSGWDGAGTNFTANRTVTTIRWESQSTEPTRVSYAFGAVLRTDRDGGLVVNRPPFQFDTERTIIPIVDTDAESPGSFSGTTVRVRGERGTTRIAYAGDASMLDNLWVNVTTSRPEVWRAYLDERPGTDCSITPGPGDKRRVRCELDQREELFVAVYPIEIEIER